jgi:hypothetical protein
MPDDTALRELLRRPPVLAAVSELGLESLGVEDVLTALRGLGAVRIEAGERYTCVLEIPGEPPERVSGATVLHAALACWAETLDGARRYTDTGLEQLSRYLESNS